MKTLAILLPSLRTGGAERATVNLAAGLRAAGVPTRILVVESGGRLRRELPPDVEVVDLGGSRVLGDSRVIAGLPALVHYLKTARPHTLLSIMVHANVVAAWAHWLARAPTRLVMSERTLLSLALKHVPRPSVRWLLPRLVPRAYARAAAIVAVSQGVKQDLVSRFGAGSDRIHVIHNAVITPELERRRRGEVSHPWLARPEVPVVLAAGRLHPSKDLATLIRAFARARRERPLRLLILGEGEERPQLERLLAALGLEADVQLPGFVEDVPAYMSRAALFVLSSRWDGLPAVVIEALAMGCPVVSTNCPGGAREILGEGRFGRLVPPGDEAALASAMLAALDAPREDAALRRRAADFSLPPMVARYRQVLEV